MLRRTADDDDPFERIVVANAEQLVIVTAVADPVPRTGFVDRCLVAAYAGGLAPVLCLTKADLADPEAVRRRRTATWTCRCWSPAATSRPTELAELLARAGVGAGRALGRGQVDAGQRCCCRTPPGPWGWCPPSARAGTPPSPRSPCRCRWSTAAAGWSTPRASGRSGSPTSPPTTSPPRSTTSPPPSRTARAAAGTSARPPTRSAPWTRSWNRGSCGPGRLEALRRVLVALS